MGTRRSSVSSKRSRLDDDSNEEFDEVEHVKAIKDDLLKILFNEANKCNKGAIEQILNRFEDLELVTMRLIRDNSFLEGRIKEMKKYSTTGEEIRNQKEGGLVVPVSNNVVKSYAIVVKGKDENASKIKEKLMKVETDAKIQAVKQSRAGGLVIQTTNEKDLNKIKDQINKQEQGWTIEEARRRDPTLLVYDVPEKIDNEEFAKEVYKKNVAALMGEEEFIKEFRVEPYEWKQNVRGMPLHFRVISSKKAAIVVNDESIEVMEVGEFRREWAVCAWLKGDFGECVVCSLYCVYGEGMEDKAAYLEELWRKFGRLKMLVGLDANAVSPLWHSKWEGWREDERVVRGRVLEEVILREGIAVLNSPSDEYTYSGPGGQSDIDVTLCTDGFLGLVRKWCVRDEVSCSDHNLIELELGYHIDRDCGPPPGGWVVCEGDWPKFDACFLDEVFCVEREFALLDAEGMVELMTKMVRRAGDRSFKVNRGHSNRRVRWWNERLGDLRARCRRSRRVYQRLRRHNAEGQDAARARYIEEWNEYKNEIRKAKEEDWRRFVDRVGNVDPWGGVYKIIRGRKGRICMGAVRKDNGEMTVGWEDTASALLNEFFPPDEKVRDEVRLVGGARMEPVTEEEVEVAVKRINGKKAPGLDGIKGDIVKRVWALRPDLMHRMYEQCVLEGTFPREWKKANVVVLLKSPDKDRAEIRSYRPICLLSVFGKVMERIMVNRLLGGLEGSMSDCQYGFTVGRGTEDAWLKVMDVVEGSACKYVLGMFIDFKGAFDFLRWCRILDVLGAVGCREIELWKSYFCERKVCYRNARGEMVWKDVSRGCPQGSICGPFVWNLCMNELLRGLGELGAQVVAYADDLLVLVEGNSRRDLESRGSEYLGAVLNWGRHYGVEVSATKSSTLILKGTLSSTRPVLVKAQGISLKSDKKVKYLGIHVEERLKFGNHLKLLRKKIVDVASGLRRVIRDDWGLGRTAIKTIFNGLLMACALYGSSVWWKTLRTGKGVRLLNTCERAGLLVCLRVCRTVSTDAMEVLMGVLPWRHQALLRTVMFLRSRGRPVGLVGVVEDRELEDLGRSGVRDLLRDRLFARWQREWDGSETGRVLYCFVPDVETVRRCKWFWVGMHEGYIMTGQGSMNAWLHDRGLSESPECECGAPREDWMHVLVECVLYEDLRDLEAMGLVVENDGEINGLREIVMNEESFKTYVEFARNVFARRVRMVPLLTPVRLSGSSDPAYLSWSSSAGLFSQSNCSLMAAGSPVSCVELKNWYRGGR
ncbi:Putative 115 kDa protein in type-1 retrotransposable element R1DM-like Protein [Tribolium castaneum]|uniref:115 kDa protein in type-1 retrotransposable element R1DM-like Protein n=1 Tax=Tribolium castaneum TaxID=7070 RepID=D7GXM9_TRICA|nr:Putative 115 kDa protein in type-1 retrotransposable element R1DM-like Protein [Tribolium castaneum]